MISLTSPHRTRAHDWPAGAKLLALCLASTGLVLVRAPAGLAAILAATVVLYLLGGRAFFLAGVRTLRVVLPFVIIVALWQIFFGTPVEGLRLGIQIVTAFAMANLVTMTTTLEDMVDVTDRLLSPLQRLGLNPAALRLAIPMVIRSVPAIANRITLLRTAWRARSRRRPGWQILLPCALGVLDDSDRMAEALRARGGLAPQSTPRPNRPGEDTP